MSENELITSNTLKEDAENTDRKLTNIASAILQSDGLDEVKSLTHLFNLNQNKKNVIRILKLNGLLDNVTEELVNRVENFPNAFSNEELLKTIQVIQTSIDKSNTNLNLIDESPAIKVVQNNQVNVNIIDTLDRDSRERIYDALQGFLSKSDSTQKEIIDVESKEVDEEE